MTQRRAGVTGATGFLGRRLVAALLAEGWAVRALSRRPLDAGFWGERTPDIVPGDLKDEAALAALARDTDLVIHVAGLIKALNRPAFFTVNEAGAARVARAADGAGARMLHISSLAAREPSLSDYAASKRAGEDAARAVLGERLTVLRPPAIYGPGDRETAGMFKAVSSAPILPLPGPETSRLALAHVDDVVAVILALAGGEPAPGCYAVGGARPEGYAWREIFTAAAVAVGSTARLATAPAWLVLAAGAASDALGRFRGQAAIFGQGKAREILHADWSVTPTEQAPGAPVARFSLEAGFADAVAWCRQAGWLA